MKIIERIDAWLCMYGPLLLDCVVVAGLLAFSAWVIGGEYLRSAHG